MAITRKRKKMEAQIWGMRRSVDSDTDGSEPDNEFDPQSYQIINESNEPETFQIVPSKLSSEQKISVAPVHPAYRPKKLKTLEIVTRKLHPSDRSHQAQAKGDGMNPPESRHSVSECDKEAEGFGEDPVGAEETTRPVAVTESENKAEDFNGDSWKSASAPDQEEGDYTETESENGAEESIGAKSASAASESYQEEEGEESDGPEIVSSSRKSAYDVSESESDTEEEESDQDCAEKTVPRAVLRTYHRRAKIDPLNPEASHRPQRPYSTSFLTQENSFRFDSFWKKGVVDQRLADLGSYASLGIEQILEDNHLLHTVTCVKPYVLEVVMEFYANLPSKGPVKKTFVRGQMFEFSPKLINSVLKLRERKITRVKETSIDVELDLIAETLTGGNVKDWNKITPAYLTPPVAALHNICCANWIPTSNTCALSADRARFLYILLHRIPFNFGKLVHDQIVRLAQMADSKFRPVLPALIFQVLSYQRAIQLYEGESLSHLAQPMCNHVRLNRGKHVSPSPPSARKGKGQGRNSKNAAVPSTSARKAKLKEYVDKAIKYLQLVSDSLTADDTSNDEEETDDDYVGDAGTE